VSYIPDRDNNIAIWNIVKNSIAPVSKRLETRIRQPWKMFSGSGGHPFTASAFAFGWRSGSPLR
jgi:hypothetical protein